jgi:hypothetical protein
LLAKQEIYTSMLRAVGKMVIPRLPSHVHALLIIGQASLFLVLLPQVVVNFIPRRSPSAFIHGSIVVRGRLTEYSSNTPSHDGLLPAFPAIDRVPRLTRPSSTVLPYSPLSPLTRSMTTAALKLDSCLYNVEPRVFSNLEK